MEFTHLFQKRLMGLVCLLGLLCAACGQESTADGWSLDEAVPQPRVDASPTEPDAAPVEPDSEPSAPDTPPVEPMEFDPELWDESNPCSPPVSYDAPPQSFSIPEETSSLENREMTREQLLRWRGGLDSRDSGAEIRLGASTNPGAGSWHDFNMFVEPGTDIPIHVYPYHGDDLDEYRFNVTVMVDYEPVEAVYTRWNADRTDTIEETTATGYSAAFHSDVEIVDVTIPSEVFDERRMYEIAVSVDLTSVASGVEREHRRYALYHGGYKRPDRPCAETSIEQAMTSAERYMWLEADGAGGVLFFDGIPADYDWHDQLEVEPGETRRFYFSAMYSDDYGEAKDVVFVPVINGQPIRAAWWVRSLPNRYSNSPTVDDRKSFEVTFPEEPGVYDVQVLYWADPYELAQNIFGTPVDGVEAGGGAFSSSSNDFRFVVRP